MLSSMATQMTQPSWMTLAENPEHGDADHCRLHFTDTLLNHEHLHGALKLWSTLMWIILRGLSCTSHDGQPLRGALTVTPRRLPFTRCAHSLISLYMAWESTAESCKLQSTKPLLIYNKAVPVRF